MLHVAINKWSMKDWGNLSILGVWFNLVGRVCSEEYLPVIVCASVIADISSLTATSSEKKEAFVEEMASITACTSNISLARPTPLLKGSSSRPSTSVLAMSPRMGKIRCSMDEKADEESNESSKLGMGAMMAAACAATMSSPAMALVDERMSTEGTGLPFGLSNNLLGWILFGVFGLIWSLFFIYTGGLEEDEDSGLSL